MRRHPVLLALLVAAGAQDGGRQAPLDRLMPQQYPVQPGPAHPRLVPSRLAIISRLTNVAVGVEEAAGAMTSGGPAAPVDTQRLTVRTAIDAIVALDNRYEWRDVGDVAVVRPREAWTDCSHPLNRRITIERARDVSMHEAISLILSSLDPTQPAPAATTRPDVADARFAVPAGTMLILELLNQLARQHGVSWALSGLRLEGGRSEVSLSLRDVTGRQTGVTRELTAVTAPCR